MSNLAQQFAQVRSDVAECCHDCDDGCQRDKTVAALSVIERHVQDMEKALRDFAEHGTRFDCNPTVMIHGDNEEWMRIHSWWVGRAHDMDAGVRRRARAALPAPQGDA